MKFWKNLAQVFFGIIIGYVIARIMHIVLAFSSIPLLVQALSITNGESGSVLGAVVSLGLSWYDFGWFCRSYSDRDY